MREHKFEDEVLRYILVKPGNAFNLCFKIIEKYGLAKAMSGKPVSQFKGITIDWDGSLDKHAQFFKNGPQISLSTLELLSMAYLVTYYQHQDKSDKEYLIGVDIEDRRKELYLSDGLLAITVNGEAESITPFQQVIAQNIVGNNIKSSIQEEIIRQAQVKIARRSSYNTISGLIISALPKDGTFDLAALCDACNLEAFVPTFLMIYRPGLTTCMAECLDSNIKSLDDLRGRTLQISPQLAKSKI